MGSSSSLPVDSDTRHTNVQQNRGMYLEFNLAVLSIEFCGLNKFGHDHRYDDDDGD